jgi:hypothetical protein
LPKKEIILFGAHFLGLSEYASPMICTSFLIEKIEKYSKECSTVENSSHLMQNCLAIQNMLAPYCIIPSLLGKIIILANHHQYTFYSTRKEANIM